MLKSRAIGCAFLAVALAAVGGCDQGSRDQWDDFWGVRQVPTEVPASGVPVDGIAVSQLAARLNLRLVRSGAFSASLADSANTVQVTGDPGGRVSVNGRSIVSPGPIASAGGRLYVSEALVSAIRATLRKPRAAVPAIAPAEPASSQKVGGVSIIEVRPPVGPRLGPVLIDAGHGGKDDGASGYISTGFRRQKVAEKDVNLATSLEVARLLRKRNVEVVLTRSDDTFIDKHDRARTADRLRVKLMVSIHADASAGNTQAVGYTVYLGHNAVPGSTAAANAIDARLKMLGIPRRGVKRHPRRIVVINMPHYPSVLIEQGYLTNQLEAARLNDPVYRARLAGAIASGIVDYLKATPSRR